MFRVCSRIGHTGCVFDEFNYVDCGLLGPQAVAGAAQGEGMLALGGDAEEQAEVCSDVP
jgi:hypothetical protein